MHRKITLFIAFSAALLLLIVFSLTPHAAQATSRRAPQGKSKIGLPLGTPLNLVSAASRKKHGIGGAGSNFDIDMPLSATLTGSDSGIECRTGGDSDGGTGGDYLIVLTFDDTVTTASSATVTFHNPSGAGGTAGTPSFAGTEMTIPLSGVTNGQVLTLNVTDVAGTGDSVTADINIGFLIGDTSSNRTTNASDVSQTKSHDAEVVDGTNFRTDITHNDEINSSDISVAKAASGTGAP